MQEVSGFANEVSLDSIINKQSCTEALFSVIKRGWQINPTTQTVHFVNKAEMAVKDAIPKKATIMSNLQFAKELESIV